MGTFAIRQTYADEGVTGFTEISAATLRRSGALAQVLGPSGQVIRSYGGDLAQDPLLSGSHLSAAAMGGEELSTVTSGIQASRSE